MLCVAIMYSTLRALCNACHAAELTWPVFKLLTLPPASTTGPQWRRIGVLAQ